MAIVMNRRSPALKTARRGGIYSMVEHYLLPIAVLLETARDLPEMASLRAQMPAVPGIWKEACIAEIIVGCGCIYACTIITTEGQLLLQQEAALHALEQLGELEWTFGLSFAAGTPLPQQEGSCLRQNGTLPHRMDGTVPQRSDLFVIPALLEALPRRQKHVLLLANGHKQASEIARLLGLEPGEVERLLHQLYHQHLIHYTTGESS